MRWWHLTFSSPRRANVFGNETTRRSAVRAIVRVSGEALLLFCVVDDHVHVVVVCREAKVPNLRRALAIALSSLSGERLVSHVQPVESRAHLVRLVTYLLRQPGHHGLAGHLATYSGSCFQDLIGARQIDGFSLHIARELPRMRLQPVYSAVGLPERPLVPADDEAIRRVGASRLVDASFAALAADPSRRGRAAPCALARRLAAHVSSVAGIARADLAWALELTPQRVGQLVAAPRPSESLVRAVRLQVALHQVVNEATLRAG